MANEPDYNQQIANLMKLSADGNKYNIDNLPGGASSLNRFARTFYATTILPDTVKSQQDAVGDIYSVINAASVPYNDLKCSLLDASAPPQDTWPTVWISAADLNARILYYSNVRIGNRVWVDLNKVNLSEDQKPKSIDLENAQLVGDLSSQF